MSLDQVIIKPLLTEKTTAATKFNRYFFKVSRLSNKNQIKAAVERIFKVRVVKVRTVNLPGKVKRSQTNRRLFETGSFKKAIVELKEGDKIGLFEVEEKKKGKKVKK